MAAGSISDERFDDYCYNSVMDNVNNGTGEYKYVEALRPGLPRYIAVNDISRLNLTYRGYG